MPKYNLSKIYTIRYKHDNDLVYVGSTTLNLCRRLCSHRYDSRNERCKNMILYKTIQEKSSGCWDDWYIELYEDFPCERREQLLKREGEIIREIGTLNQVVAGRTNEEYCKESVEKIKERRKKYTDQNKEKIKEKSKVYAENNKEKKKAYREENKEKIKEHSKIYREEHKEEIKEKKRQEYLKNKEKIIERVKNNYNKNKERILEYHKQYYKNKKIIS